MGEVLGCQSSSPGIEKIKAMFSPRLPIKLAGRDRVH